MKKSLILALSISLSYASEFQFGTGTFTMKGGFLGLSNSIDNDIASFTLGTRHSNFGEKFFYGYDFTWYDSKDLVQAQKDYNNFASGLSIPQMKYRVKGLDINIRAGYDVIHQDQDNFLGVGLVVGASFPWIDSSKSAVPNLDFFQDNMSGMSSGKDMFDDSKTDIMTYKVGPTITFQKALVSNKLSMYGVASYAYQTGSLENDYAKSDFDVDGTFQEYNIGLYYAPFTTTFKWGFLTLNPRLYFTLGYKYSKWSVDEVAINTSGTELSSDALSALKQDFDMISSIGYFGVGYSF